MLPKTSVLGPPGYPVVSLDEGIHAERASMGAAPVRGFDEVARRLDGRGHSLPPGAVSLLAFVATEMSPVVLGRLLGTRAYCRVILLLDECQVPGEPELSEYDYHGFTIASPAPAGGVTVHVAGDRGRRPGSDIGPAWARHREEQLYAAALADRASNT